MDQEFKTKHKFERSQNDYNQLNNYIPIASKIWKKSNNVYNVPKVEVKEGYAFKKYNFKPYKTMEDM